MRCFLPYQAQQFVKYFSSHNIIQIDGLDDTGTELSIANSTPNARKPIRAELISGTREQIYWESKPKKVNMQAVEETVQALKREQDAGTTSVLDDSSNSRRKRKKGRGGRASEGSHQ